MKTETELSQVTPYCYCCLSGDNLTEHHFGGMTYDLCPDCNGAGFAYGEPYQNKLVMTFWCPCHGDRHLDYLPRFFIGLDYINKKNGTRKTGTRVRLGVNWKLEVEKLRKEYQK